jgi:hypothetical protein
MANNNCNGNCIVRIVFHSVQDASSTLEELTSLAAEFRAIECPSVLGTDRSQVSARFRYRVQGVDYYQSIRKKHEDIIKSGEVIGGEGNRGYSF